MRTKSTRNEKRGLRALGLALTFGALTLIASPAAAQTTSLSVSIVEAASVGGSQRDQIQSFADHWSGRALQSDSQQASRAQAKLLEPLINPRVSIAFRQAYDESLGAYFDQLSSNGDIGSTLSALRISGELGTEDSVARIIAGLEHRDPGVQIFAAGRAGRVFRTTAANGPALSIVDLDKLIAALKKAASGGDQALVGACIQSLGQGGSLPSDEFLAQRARSLSVMCDAASEQVVSDSDLETRARMAMQASSFATNSLLQVGEDSNTEAVRSAVALGANMIAISLSDVINSTMPAVGERDLQVTLVRSGESLLYFALREHAELNRRPIGNVEQTAFADLLEEGEDRSFRNQAALLLGPGSPIVTEFDFEDDQFVN
ncbi:MAG: hypothetical protein JJ974_11725 [Phycisphaerales bacterium]|nr:hypothetical protein [Phycisphaerales bacterium]